MPIDLKLNLNDIYHRYGFELAKSYENGRVVVFTIKNGYYDNADIVPLTDDADTSIAFNDFQKAGYACKIRKYQTAEEAENHLFKGFFQLTPLLRDKKTTTINSRQASSSHFHQMQNTNTLMPLT